MSARRLLPPPSSGSRTRSRGESTLPMINVVFLLLIFFLITAQIAPPAPFAVTPPEAEGGTPAPPDDLLILHLDAEATPGFATAEGMAQGDPALTALEAARTACPDCTLTLRADRAAPARPLAALLPQLARMGFAQVDLVTRPAKP